jgi:hypothetical protein
MATITRGFTYEPDSFVTHTNLHTLIDAATISDLSLDDFAGTVRGVYGSEPDSPVEGDAWFRQDRPPFTASPYSGSSMPVIMVQSTFGQVALFTPYGIETRRIVAGSDQAVHDAGMPVLMETSSGGETLAHYGANAVGNIKISVIGNNRVTLSAGGNDRITIIGLCAANVPRNITYHQTLPTFLRRTGTMNNWLTTAATGVDGVFGVRLTDYYVPSAGQERLPALIWGAPLWHT